MGSRRSKVVLAGDTGVGKTSLLMIMTSAPLHVGYTPRVYYPPVQETWVNGNKVELTFCDTDGSDNFVQERLLSYPGAAVILICFGVDNKVSFENVKQRWLPEILHFNSSPKVPLLLVGCRTDLRRTNGVTSEQGHAMADEIGGVKYIECSAKNEAGLREVLTSAGSVAASRGFLSRRNTCVQA